MVALPVDAAQRTGPASIADSVTGAVFLDESANLRESIQLVI